MFFFFQAEDGIRDYKVTGVQTCALPISAPAVGTLNGTYTYSASTGAISLNVGAGDQFTGITGSISDASMTLKIGRASCRERVELSEGGGSGQARCTYCVSMEHSNY